MIFLIVDHILEPPGKGVLDIHMRMADDLGFEFFQGSEKPEADPFIDSPRLAMDGLTKEARGNLEQTAERHPSFDSAQTGDKGQKRPGSRNTPRMMKETEGVF